MTEERRPCRGSIRIEGGGELWRWGVNRTKANAHSRFPFSTRHQPHTMDTTPHTLAEFLFPDDLRALALARRRAVGAAPPAPRRAPRAAATVVASPAAFDEVRTEGGVEGGA